MIPTIRSMLVATLLTMTVLVGGFGLFAAFRVNHEPLARLPVAATPFQLAFVDAAPRALSFAPDQSHLESSEALRAVATAVSTPDSDEVAAVSATADDGATKTRPALEQIATALASDATAVQPTSGSANASGPADTATKATPPESAPGAAKPGAAITGALLPETAQPAAPTLVTVAISEMPPQDAAAPVTAAQETAGNQQETVRQIAIRKRQAVLRHARRIRAAAVARAATQNNGFPQSNFQSASGFQTAQSGFGESLGGTSTTARRHN
jgi:hypothetical protein